MGEVRDFLSEFLFSGIKCQGCKRRVAPNDWVYCYQKKGCEDQRGWRWCPYCDTKRYVGFQDRVFA